MSTTTNLDTLKINYLTQAQYETALENDQINDNELYFTPSSGADTVVEQGTSGDWHYRKWASGYLELDAIKTATISFTNWGSLSYAEISLSALPFAVVSQYSTSVIAFSGSVSCWGGMMNSGAIRIYSQSGAGSNHSVTVSRQIRGTWK